MRSMESVIALRGRVVLMRLKTPSLTLSTNASICPVTRMGLPLYINSTWMVGGIVRQGESRKK